MSARATSRAAARHRTACRDLAVGALHILLDRATARHRLECRELVAADAGRKHWHRHAIRSHPRRAIATALVLTASSAQRIGPRGAPSCKLPGAHE